MLAVVLLVVTLSSVTALPLCMWAGGCKISDVTCTANGISCGSSGPSGCCSGVCGATGKCVAASPTPQCTYTKPLKCWKQAYPTNTVFLNTLSGPNGHDAHVQMGYISVVNDDLYPVERLNGSPVMTPQYAKDLCDALTENFCGGVQIFMAPPPEKFQNSTRYDNWANLLTPAEFTWYKDTPETLPSTTPVKGYAYQRVAC